MPQEVEMKKAMVLGFTALILILTGINTVLSESEYAPIKFNELAAGYRITVMNNDYTEVVCHQSTSALETGEFWDNLVETFDFTYDTFSDLWQLDLTEEKAENYHYVIEADEIILLELGDVRYY